MTKKQDQKLTNTQSKLLNIISYYMGISPSKTVYLTLEFLCSELRITQRQLQTVRKGINHIFDSEWRKATKIDGVIRRKVYVFKQKGNLTQEMLNLKVKKPRVSNTYRNKDKLSRTQLKLIDIISPLIEESPNKTIYLPIKFLCESLLITDRQLRTVRKGISHMFVSKWRNIIKVDGLILRNIYIFTKVGNLTLPPSNLKKSELLISNKEEKNFNKNIDLKSKFFNFKNSYSKAKTLSEMIPSIDNKICEELRSKSGRPFSDNFITQLVLKMSKNPKVKATFNYLKGFIAYMVEVLKHEKHDAVKTGNVNFKFKDNIPVNNNEQQETPEPLKLPDGVWGDICQKLVDIHGQSLYKNWFSKLTPVINEETKTLEIKASNSFVQQWIEDNYKNIIEKITITMGLKFKEIIL